MATILLVEDDPVLGKGLELSLKLDGHQVVWAETLQKAKKELESDPLDLVLLDLNLPDGYGLDFAKRCQSEFPELPILIITARSDEETVLAGYAAGAMDFVRKPFSNRELMAKIRAVLEKWHQKKSADLKYDDLRVIVSRRKAYCGEVEINLNRREFDILVHFLQHAEDIVSRDSLLHLLDKEGEIFDRTIDSHVSHLRSRLKQSGAKTVQITSLYGVGYRLEKRT